MIIETSTQNHYKRNTGFAIGAFLLLIGIILILFNTEILPSSLRGIIFSWQMLLIVLGISSVFGHHSRSRLMLLIIGIFFIIPKFSVFYSTIPDNFVKTYWPVLLVIGGLLLIVKRNQKNHYYKRKRFFHQKYNINQATITQDDKKTDYFHYKTVMSDGEYIFANETFRGGETESVFGNVTIDLRKAIFSEIETTLHLKVVCGKLTLIVPENLHISIKSNCFCGEFKDKRRFISFSEDKKLIIKGECVFGQVEITD